MKKIPVEILATGEVKLLPCSAVDETLSRTLGRAVHVCNIRNAMLIGENCDPESREGVATYKCSVCGSEFKVRVMRCDC